MSTFFNDIYAGFRERLVTIPGAPPIAWENDSFDNKPNILYLKPFLLPADSQQSTLGDNGQDEHNGIFQVSVYIPVGDGMSAWPDSVADHFKRGTTLIKNDVKIRVRSVSIASGFRDDNFYIVPVSVDYQVFTAARTTA